MKKLLAFFILVSINLFSEEMNDVAALNRSDTIPQMVDGTPDSYFEGYLQALVDMHYYEFKVIVVVKDHNVWLGNLPKNTMIANSIISFIQDVPGAKEVKVMTKKQQDQWIKKEKYELHPQVKGIWFPQSTVLYMPIIANPRAITYSAGYRWGDKVVGKDAIAISFGDDFPLFRWIDILPWRGDLQVGIDACVWSVFRINIKGYNPNRGTELVNSDYFVGLPLTYAVNKWAFRLRGYHVSAHLGDEFLVNHIDYVNNVTRKPAKPVRVNPSFEAVDFFTSYQATNAFRVVLGPGFILHSDRSFPMKKFYVEYGAEARFWGLKLYYQRLFGTFFASVYFRNWQYFHWNLDGTYAVGYEWSKLQGIGRKIRFYVEYHHGYSLEGQFMKDRTSYGCISMSYGF